MTWTAKTLQVIKAAISRDDPHLSQLVMKMLSELPEQAKCAEASMAVMSKTLVWLEGDPELISDIILKLHDHVSNGRVSKAVMLKYIATFLANCFKPSDQSRYFSNVIKLLNLITSKCPEAKQMLLEENRTLICDVAKSIGTVDQYRLQLDITQLLFRLAPKNLKERRRFALHEWHLNESFLDISASGFLEANYYLQRELGNFCRM